jgi:HJR/Mrr/RecB family endonuclease
VALGVVLLARMVSPEARPTMLTLTCALVLACAALVVVPWPGARRQAYSAAALHALSPAEFERRVAELFARAGFQARVAGASGDGGVDVRVWRDGRRGVVQCKRYRPDLPVGPAVVRELVGVRAHERADTAWLATTGRLTDGARRLAAAEGIVVLDAAALQAWETSLSWRWPRWWWRRLGIAP